MYTMPTEVAHITTTEVAHRARVKPSTVRRWVERGYLVPSVKTPGGHYRFDPAEVDRVIHARPAEDIPA